ncbi:DUF3426 domain-containing protein [Phenylobacterium sp.]|uniref:DUF3426 domain-containing protein n=1 Tax=Phenylobacterium sp. TaxID=1871053 RepID=UPI00272FA7E6|nr:DUF3426 domain-containing protein [Phenylobacterium sp.]MDP1617032.1 DUF3426 domain-containing protein [Phenylobacterium sp.]MDP1987003.1 DUF3426 domain-containing protein [Phenylobacterium sp.]
MILTCPDCSTSYFVDDAKIPEDGRVVKCASCGHRWTARREIELNTALPAAQIEPAPADTPTTSTDQADPEKTAAAAEGGVALPKAFRAKADDNRRLREAAATGVVWAGMSAALALMIAVAVVFRVDVVRLWPSSAGAFASVGLPVNSIGLAIEGVEFEPALHDGHAALSVSGMIRNIEDRTITAPPLQIRLLDKSGAAVATKVARAADPNIPPGETRHFAIAIIDPPGTAADLEISFAELRAAAEPPAEPAALDLRGAAEAADPAIEAREVLDAKPLPADDHEAQAHHDG